MKLASAVLASLRKYIHEVNFGFLRLSKHIDQEQERLLPRRPDKPVPWFKNYEQGVV